MEWFLGNSLVGRPRVHPQNDHLAPCLAWVEPDWAEDASTELDNGICHQDNNGGKGCTSIEEAFGPSNGLNSMVCGLGSVSCGTRNQDEKLIQISLSYHIACP
ncbi:unnamed protein product [Caretta caretta]